MSQKKILLTMLPLFWPKMPPLGLGYLQSYLIDKGNPPDILDLNNVFFNLANDDLKKSWLVSCNIYLEENIFSIIKKEHPKEFEENIGKILSYDIAGFSCFKSNFETTIEIIKILKLKREGIKIILGGPEISRQYFKTNGRFDGRIMALADLLVAGEGERAIYDFSVGKASEKILKFHQLKNLDALPFPKFQGVNLKQYQKNGTIPLFFSRGCVRKCRFCSERLLFKGFRCRKVGSVIDEIKYYLKNGIKNFVFFDSMLNADLKKFEGLCDAIIDNFGSINWEAQIAVRKDMDKNLFEKMKKSGCYNLFIGLESGSDNTLRRMNKGFTPEDARIFFEKLNNAGLFFGISLITGYPGETEEEFRESMDFVIGNKKIIPKIEQINPFTYYDGTDTDEKGDYKLNPVSLERMEIFVDEIKKNNFKYTNAFLGNLIEK